MSWATEDWTTGLSGHVLQKVRELQAHNEKLTRERQQRQLQLDNSEAALHKQKLKYEEVRVELSAVQRELVGVREGTQAEVRTKERLAQELQGKTAQVCALENQLESAKALTQKLTQEVKRLEAELEKLQKESLSGDSVLFSTPCWNMNSPWDQNGVKSSLRGEDNVKAHCVRQQLLFEDSPKPSVGGVSSQFPQQPHKTPSLRRGVVYQSEARTLSSVFPWERDDTRPTPKGRPVSSSFASNDVIVTDSDSRDNGAEEALRKERDDLYMRVSGLQKELQVEKERFRETESRLAQTQKEINMKEQNLARSKDELARAQTKITQEGDRAQTAEQRVKQLQEELKCQRQNAETSRCNAEQRRKDMEREHQKELLELQRERQAMEKQHQQESNRLNQEIQQARTAHNTLQAQYDKLALQKQTVERDLEGVQAKLRSTEADLTETKKRETQTLAKLTESLRENETLRVSLEQLKKREKSLEAEVKRLTEELTEALKLIKELQAQLAAPPPQLASYSCAPVAGDGYTPVLSIHYDRPPPHQHSAQRKRAPKTERPKDTDRPGPLTYPSDREPCEGIESEHVSEYGSGESVTLNVKAHEGNQHGTGRRGEVDVESSITEQDTGIEDTDTDSYMSDSTSDRMFKDEGFSQTDIRYDSGGKNSTSSQQGHKQDSSSLKELKKENAAFRDELRDIKSELERRLDDLETQRRAEAEARTKLKQLSKKHSSQAEQHRIKVQEFKEKGSKLEIQLEQERKESARLREVVAALEKEAEKRQGEEESKDENIKLKEALSVMERKEEQLEEEREKMQKELQMLQSELLQEREERMKEREEENKRLKNSELEVIKIAELQAELSRLQRSAGCEDKNTKDNMPLTYLQLGNQPNTTDDVSAFENSLISSPDACVSFCESNLQNTMFSKETRIMSLITESDTWTKSPEHFLQDTEDSTSATHLNKLGKSREGTDLDETTILILEVERLRVQRDKEAQRSEKTQKKLEVLQNQVTNQTQQLTLAFENQSKHIDGLLKELVERDNALQRQEEELQSCRKEIAVLKADTHTKETMTPNTEQFGELLEESGCDLVTSSAIPGNLKVVKEEDSLTAKDKLEFDSQPTIIVEDGKDQSGNINAEQDRSFMCEVTINTKEPVALHTSDAHSGDSVCHTENTKAKGTLKPHTAAQQHRGYVVEMNTENTESFTTSPDKPTVQSFTVKFPQSRMENPNDDVRELKKVINELHAAQTELSQLKAKHDQLTLQLQEVSKEDFLVIKQENEQLKLKLQQMAKETGLSQKPSVSTQNDTHLTNTKEIDQPFLNKDPHGNSGDGEGNIKEKVEEENGDSEDKAYSSAQTHSLREQVQALQIQLQLLSEQNTKQAEELKLWRLSTSSQDETMDDHSNSRPIVLVREDQLVLSCSPTLLHTDSQQTRSMRKHGDLSQPKGCSGSETGVDEKHGQLRSNKTTGNCHSELHTRESITDNNHTVPEANDQQKSEIMAVDVYSASLVSSSVKENFEDKNDLTHQIKPRGSNEKAPETENQSKENAFRTEIQEDCSVPDKSEAKVMDPMLNIKRSDMGDTQVACLNHGEVTLRPVDTLGRTTDQQNDPATVLGRQTSNSAQRTDDDAIKSLATDQGQRSGITGKVGQASSKEVKNVSTQTEECSGHEVKEAEGSIAPQGNTTQLHASTQTQAEEMKQPEKEEEQNDDLTNSSSSSLVLPSNTEKILFTGSFPIPADPAYLAERIRRNRSRMSAAYDDTEYEPYGLPEVVMKGFADIPSGPACPYVLRRGLLGTDALPVSLREPLKEAEEDIDP